MTTPTNVALMKLHRRAESGDAETLVETFVDVGPLFTLLNSHDHQVMYGRRGTGKTHALTYLQARVVVNGDFATLIDLRTVGSTGGLYGDDTIPLAQRGTRLLVDVLSQLHDSLIDYVLERADALDLSQAMSLLDRFGDAITDVQVVGHEEREQRETDRQEDQSGGRFQASMTPVGPQLDVGVDTHQSDTSIREQMTRVSGIAAHRVHFGRVAQVLRSLVDVLPVGRIWVLLDEWASVPMDLQPLLADLLRRALFPVPGVVVKIAAIEQRSRFSVPTGPADYLGIELGADAAADLDLDDFMVFGNDPEAAKHFFRELLFKHVAKQLVEDGADAPQSAESFQRESFTQRNAIDEFVRAAEGVPRDAINIVRYAAQRADNEPIGVQHVRTAGRRWYLVDKERAVQSNSEAVALLHWIVDIVIGERRARAFLLQQQFGTSALVAELYDARVLHVIKRSVSSRDNPGVRYDVYQLDYGCYVELIATTRAPEGLFQAVMGDGQEVEDDGDQEASWVTVPSDDYRSIRRAILDLAEFDSRPLQLPTGPN